MESNIEEIKIFAENVKFFNRLTTDVFERVGLTKTNLFLTLKSASSLQRRLCRQNNDFIDNTVLPLLKKETPLSKDEKNYLTSLALSLYNADEKRFDDPCFTAEIWEKLVNDRLAAYRKTHSEKVLAEMIRGLIYHYYSVLDTASTVFFKWSVALFEKIFALNILPKASDIKNKKLVHDIVRAVCGFYPCMVHNSVCMLSTEDSARALDTVFAASSALCDAFLGDGDDRLRNADTVEYYRKDFLSSSVRHRLTSGLGGAEHIEEAKKIITETLPYIPVDLRAVITDGAPFPSNAKHIKFIDDVLSTFYDLFFLAYYTGAITEKNYYDGLCSFGEFVVKYTAKDRHGYFISATLELLKILEKDSLKLDGEQARRYEMLVPRFIRYLSRKKPAALNILFGSLDEIQTVFLAYIRREYGENSIASRKKYVSLIVSSLLRVHIPTLVHSLMVAKMMKLAAVWFCDNAPEKLIGICSAADADEVRAKKTEITEQVYLCGLAHDLGKINYIDAISKVCRKLTDKEFTLIKEHCNRGTEVLSAQEFENECYVARYHHRTSHGESAREYPQDAAARNFASHPYFFIVKLCYVFDGIDAATDYIGRGYQNTKPATLAMDETVADPAFRARAAAKWAKQGLTMGQFYKDCDPSITALFAIPSFRRKILTVLDSYRRTAYDRAYRNSPNTIE